MHERFPDSGASSYPVCPLQEVTMARSREAYWHFQCPECGFGDGEFGDAAAAEDIYCVVCLEEDGKQVALRRWAIEDPDQAGLPGDLAAA